MAKGKNTSKAPNPLQPTSRDNARVSRHSEKKVEAARTSKEKAAKQAEQRRRREEKARQKEAQAAVQSRDDTDDVRDIKARLAEAEAALAASIRENDDLKQKEAKRDKAQQNEIALGSIPRPTNISKVKVTDVRRLCGLKDRAQKDEWVFVRNVVRESLTKGRIDYSESWRGQNTSTLVKVFDAINEAAPVMQRFKNGWATEILAHEAFSSRKTYKACRNNPDRYRGKHRTRWSPSVSPSPRRELSINSDNHRQRSRSPDDGNGSELPYLSENGSSAEEQDEEVSQHRLKLRKRLQRGDGDDSDTAEDDE